MRRGASVFIAAVLVLVSVVLVAGRANAGNGARIIANARATATFAQMEYRTRHARDVDMLAAVKDEFGRDESTIVADNPAPPGADHPADIGRAPRVPESGDPANANAPTLAGTFEGIDDNNTTVPPDTNGAVGPAHVITAVNPNVRIADRAGTTLGSTVTLNSFFSTLPGPPATFDPRTMYDPYSDRFIMVATANAESAASSILVGVSATGDPTGSWHLYKIDADATDTDWADYPSVGFNKDWIVVTVNMFKIGPNTNSAEKVYAFDKANLYANGAGNVSVFTAACSCDTLAPASTYSATQSTLYMLTKYSSSGGLLRWASLSGSVGSETLTIGGFIDGSTAWSISPAGGADFAPQLGTATKVQNNDARFGSVVWRNSYLWGAHTVFLPSGGSPTRSAIQWWQLDPSAFLSSPSTCAACVIQRGVVEDLVTPAFFAYPSIAVNSNNDALLGYSRFSGSQYVSSNYSFRAASDPLNTMQADTVFKAGLGPYWKTFSGTRNRWGDYSSTVVDPANDFDFWTLQEYADTNVGGTGNGSGRWAVQWAHLSVGTTMQFSAPTYTIAEGGTQATITVTRTGDTSGTVGATYATSNGSASSGSDYTTATGLLSFGPGITSQTFDVPITQDTLNEGSETVNLSLSLPSGGGSLGTQASAVLTITDDDGAPTLSFSAATYSAGESDGTKTITVNRTGGSNAVTVNFATSDGTAIESDGDYVANAGTLTFGAGVNTQTFDVTPGNDGVYEDSETLNLTLSAPGLPAVLGSPSAAVLTITDDDPVPVVTFGSGSASGSEAAGTISLSVDMSGARQNDVTIDYATSNGTALAGTDYTATSGTLTFHPTDVSLLVVVPVTNSSTYRGTRTFGVTLSNPQDVTIGTFGSTTVSIVDDEVQPTVQFSPITYSTTESVGSKHLTVARAGNANDPLTVHYTTANGSALSGSDFTGTGSGIVTFIAGQTTRDILVPIVNDTTMESAETFTVTLTSVDSPGTLGSTNLTATVTIAASDQQPDGMVKVSGGSYLGSNLYNTSAVGQTKIVNIHRGSSATFYDNVQNDGQVTNSFKLKGTGSGSGYTVAYYFGATNITAAVVAGTYSTGSLTHFSGKLIKIVIKIASTAPVGSTKSVALVATWTGDNTRQDAGRVGGKVT